LHVSPDRTVQCRLYGDGPILRNKARDVAISRQIALREPKSSGFPAR